RRLADSINIRAQHPATVITLVHTLRRANRSDSALRLLRDAQFASPGDYWLASLLGWELDRRGDYEGAVRLHTAALALLPNSADTHVQLGNALSDYKKRDEAIACYRKAIELDPTFFAAHYNLGTARSEQEKWDDAIASYRQAIALKPTYARAHCNL